MEGGVTEPRPTLAGADRHVTKLLKESKSDKVDGRLMEQKDDNGDGENDRRPNRHGANGKSAPKRLL